MTTKLELNKKRKITAVLSAAEEIFLKRPYSAITMDEVAKTAGVTKKTLYTYFPSKLALFIHIIEDYLQRLNKALLTSINKELPPDQALREIIRILFSFTRENEKIMRLFWTLDSEEFEGELPQDLVMGIRFWNRGLIDHAVDLIKQGQTRGLIRPFDPETLVHVVSAFNKGIFIHTNKQSKFSIADINPERLQEVYLDLLTTGLFINPPETPAPEDWSERMVEPWKNSS